MQQDSRRLARDDYPVNFMSVSARIGLELLTRRVAGTAIRRLYVTFSWPIVLLMIYMLPDSFLNTEPANVRITFEGHPRSSQ